MYVTSSTILNTSFYEERRTERKKEEWNAGILEGWNIGTMEYGKVGF
jgi:hypothetical protein